MKDKVTCAYCGHVFDGIVSTINQKQTVTCPECTRRSKVETGVKSSDKMHEKFKVGDEAWIYASQEEGPQKVKILELDDFCSYKLYYFDLDIDGHYGQDDNMFIEKPKAIQLGIDQQIDYIKEYEDKIKWQTVELNSSNISLEVEQKILTELQAML